jgi:hypothetical protein
MAVFMFNKPLLKSILQIKIGASAIDLPESRQLIIEMAFNNQDKSLASRD